jgi:hypothetical protein
LWIFVATIVLAIAGVALQFGLRVHRQHVAIREIDRLGGAIRMRNTAPLWLKRLMGDSAKTVFNEAYDAGFLETELQDADLRHFAELTELEGFAISESQISDAALVHIEGLTRMEAVLIWEPRLTDDGLTHLRRMKMLKEIDIGSEHITDAGLEHLKSLPRLTRLILRKAKVTHAGVDELKRVLPKLDVLVLSAGYN